MKIDHKTIILTGGASGIGREILKKLITFNGVRVLVADLNPDQVLKAPQVEAVSCDTSSQEALDGLFDLALERFGRIDLFIANAGFAYYEKTEQEDWEHIERIYRTNTFSPIYCAHKMARLNRGREHGIMVTASFMGIYSLPGYSLYSSTKAALDSWASAYRRENTEKHEKGRLFILYPVATRTNFFSAASKGVPMPWPSQAPEAVAEAAIQGILCNQARIFPSRLSRLTLLLDRVIPATMPVYQAMEQFKFRRWYKQRGRQGS